MRSSHSFNLSSSCQSAPVSPHKKTIFDLDPLSTGKILRDVGRFRDGINFMEVRYGNRYLQSAEARLTLSHAGLLDQMLKETQLNVSAPPPESVEEAALLDHNCSRIGRHLGAHIGGHLVLCGAYLSMYRADVLPGPSWAWKVAPSVGMLAFTLHSRWLAERAMQAGQAWGKGWLAPRIRQGSRAWGRCGAGLTVLQEMRDLDPRWGPKMRVMGKTGAVLCGAMLGFGLVALQPAVLLAVEIGTFYRPLIINDGIVATIICFFIFGAAFVGSIGLSHHSLCSAGVYASLKKDIIEHHARGYGDQLRELGATRQGQGQSIGTGQR